VDGGTHVRPGACLILVLLLAQELLKHFFVAGVCGGGADKLGIDLKRSPEAVNQAFLRVRFKRVRITITDYYYGDSYILISEGGVCRHVLRNTTAISSSDLSRAVDVPAPKCTRVIPRNSIHSDRTHVKKTHPPNPTPPNQYRPGGRM